MIEYRSFHNSDPPKLVALWHDCNLGRGAASGFSFDAFETYNFSQTYFDPNGLIVACDDGRIVGYVHAGFGTNEEGSGLSNELGVICVVMVHPDYRRRGIGRQLVARAGTYLKQAGARTINAGPAEPRTPFYVGLYGGSEPSGFLESDPAAAPFFEALGYQPLEKHLIFQRDLSQKNDPISVRLVSVRRKMEVMVREQPKEANWRWLSRYGRIETLHFQLIPKTEINPVAHATVVGLDMYLPKWGQRAIGITDLWVSDHQRRQGYGQMLVLEICRRIREELVTLADAHVPEESTNVTALLKSCGFQQVDTGIVYRHENP